MGKKLSVVLPSYNEEQMIEKTAKDVGDILSREQIPYELVFDNRMGRKTIHGTKY